MHWRDVVALGGGPCRATELASWFLQSTHLQMSLQNTPAWKHSQYFLRQPLFLQWHPLLWRVVSAPPAPPALPGPLSALIFGLKAVGLRSRICSMALLLTVSLALLLQHDMQLQLKQ
jgi:hypothetical protein